MTDEEPEVEPTIDPPLPSPDISAALDGDAEERRYPSTIGGAFYLLVLAAAGLGIAVVWGGDWRLGIRFLASALCCAALLRLVLPARDAGMLAVRNRFFDAVLLGGIGAAIFFLVTTIPNQ